MSAPTQLNHRIAALRVLESMLSDAKEKYEASGSAVSEARNRLQAIHARHTEFVRSGGRADVDQSDWDESDRTQARQLLTALEEANNDVMKQEQQREELNQSIGSLHGQLEQHRLNASLQDVARHRSLLDQATARVSRIRGLIAENEDCIARVHLSIPESPAQDSRPEVLARLALGEADPSEISGFHAQISKEVAAEKKASSTAIALVETAEETIVGLRALLDEAEAGLSSLQASTADIEFDFLRSHAESIGKEYVQAAETVLAMWARLCALDDIVKIFRPRSSVFKQRKCHDLFIPAFSVDACTTQSRYANEGGIAQKFRFKEAISTAMDTEVEILRKSGLTSI